MSTLAENLRMARRFNGWTQEQLAERAGVSQTTIDKIEQGKTLRSKFLPNIALALNVTVEALDPSIAKAKEDWNRRLKENPGNFYVRRTIENLPLYSVIPQGETGVFKLSDNPASTAPAPRWLDGTDIISVQCANDFMSPELEAGDAAFFDVDGTLYAGKTGLFMSDRPLIGHDRSDFRYIIAKLIRADEENWYVQLTKRKIELKLSVSEWPICAPLRVRYVVDPSTRSNIR